MSDTIPSLTVPGPIPNGTSGPFWDAARRGELALQRCSDCDAWFFYARKHCPHCWSRNVGWHVASGAGEIASVSIVHRPGHPSWAPAAPYPIALVKLREGPTMLTHLTGERRLDAHIGEAVSVSFTPIGKFVLPFFSLDGERT